jgi:16S rRNA (guanine527-N7)-methyltransferase
MAPPPAKFLVALAAEGICLPPASLEALASYLGLILETNRAFNLTAVTDPEEAWQRHILESLALARMLRRGEAVVDIGSGAGLPGVPLALALPDCRLTLLESSAKKAGFLAKTAAALGLGNVTVLHARAEEAARRPGLRGAFDAAVSRAVGSLAELVELSLPLLRVGGRMLAVKGKGAGDEAAAAGNALELVGGSPGRLLPLLPAAGGESQVVEILKDRGTPEKYPRRAGIPKKRPL